MKDTIEVLGMAVLTAVVCVNLVSIITGSLDAQIQSGCGPVRRYELVVPGYRLGCFLGRPL